MCGERRWRLPSSHVLNVCCSLTRVWLGLGTKGAGQEKVSLYSKAEGFVVLFFTLV